MVSMPCRRIMATASSPPCRSRVAAESPSGRTAASLMVRPRSWSGLAHGQASLMVRPRSWSGSVGGGCLDRAHARPHPTPPQRPTLVLIKPAPDPSVLSAGQRPLQAVVHHRAPSAHRLGLLHLYGGRPGGTDGEEQFGVHVSANCAVAPVHGPAPRSVTRSSVGEALGRACRRAGSPDATLTKRARSGKHWQALISQSTSKTGVTYPTLTVKSPTIGV